MEHKIGEIVTLPDGRKAEVVEGFCEDCACYQHECLDYECWGGNRTDHKNIIYKEIKDMDTSYEKYLEEKALLEAYGHTSVITYEEWKEIKED